MGPVARFFAYIFLPWFFVIPDLRAQVGDLEREVGRERRMKNMYQGDSRKKGAEAMRLRRKVSELEKLVRTWEESLTRGYLAYMTMNGAETRVSPATSPPGGSGEGTSGWRRLRPDRAYV